MSDFKAGAAKREIRIPGEGFGMMGYGRANNVVKGRSTPLYSRAFCFAAADGTAVFFAQAEICMIFPELKRAILSRLQAAHGDAGMGPLPRPIYAPPSTSRAHGPAALTMARAAMT